MLSLQAGPLNLLHGQNYLPKILELVLKYLAENFKRSWFVRNDLLSTQVYVGRYYYYYYYYYYIYNIMTNVINNNDINYNNASKLSIINTMLRQIDC